MPGQREIGKLSCSKVDVVTDANWAFFMQTITSNPLTINAMENNTGETMLTTPELRDEEIRLAAYYLWKEKGENHGSDTEDWVQAEKLHEN